jgi:hypothetical protein
VILDEKGGIHSLVRRIDGMKAAELREFMAAMNPESVPNTEQARAIIDERDRRARERKESHDEARIEAGYSHGDDYVSQSRAALRDHGRRQRAAEEAAGSGKVEMSDARRRRLDRLAAASEANDRARDHTEDDPADKARLPVAATPGADKGSMGPLCCDYASHRDPSTCIASCAVGADDVRQGGQRLHRPQGRPN